MGTPYIGQLRSFKSYIRRNPLSRGKDDLFLSLWGQIAYGRSRKGKTLFADNREVRSGL
jgi:hypothetical protein